MSALLLKVWTWWHHRLFERWWAEHNDGVGECRFCGARAIPPLRAGEVCGGCGNEVVPVLIDGTDERH